jgi:L-rhamnose mutarotase
VEKEAKEFHDKIYEDCIRAKAKHTVHNMAVYFTSKQVDKWAELPAHEIPCHQNYQLSRYMIGMI